MYARRRLPAGTATPAQRIARRRKLHRLDADDLRRHVVLCGGDRRQRRRVAIGVAAEAIRRGFGLVVLAEGDEAAQLRLEAGHCGRDDFREPWLADPGPLTDMLACRSALVLNLARTEGAVSWRRLREAVVQLAALPADMTAPGHPFRLTVAVIPGPWRLDGFDAEFLAAAGAVGIGVLAEFDESEMREAAADPTTEAGGIIAAVGSVYDGAA